jgi:hypothetical protein
MKSSSIIADSVFLVNLKYVRLQNETKALFFKCLDEGRTLDYFKNKVRELWGNVDHSYMWQELEKYEEIIHTKNIHDMEVERISQEGDIFQLVPESVINGIEDKYVKQKIKEYARATKSYAYEIDKDTYLKNKVESFSNQIVPYFSTKTNKKIRDVELSTYASMIHNTNLTRAGWNQTWKDADSMGQELFFIPYHPFSCPHCLQYQNRVLTKREIQSIAGRSEETSGDLLHPNCKCVLTFYIPGVSSFNRPTYSTQELQEQYDIRQKVNSLTLKKEKIRGDMKIQGSLGNQDEVDKLNNERNLINKAIRELKSALPTRELKNSLAEINR